jgi:hypothetical protein
MDRHLDDAELAELATAAALGAPGGAAPAAAHLQRCPTCQAAAAALFSLTEAAFTGILVPERTAWRPDLSFLRPRGLRRIVQITAEIAAAMRQPQLAGAIRGRMLGRYVQGPAPGSPLGVTIELFEAAGAPGRARARIAIDVPGRDPFDQAGARVALRIGRERWEGETDSEGWVDLGPIPLAQIAEMRVEVSVPEA